METLFLKVLKKLIKEQLNPLSATEKTKSESYLHNNVLSLNQQTIIDNLTDDIIRFNGGENDAESTLHIITLIEAARIKVQPQREGHQKLKDEGETVTCLSQLKDHVKDLHAKISGLDPEIYAIPLLDITAKKNPLYLIYEMAIYYLGEQIFNPNPNVNLKTRTSKEIKLGERISSLSEQIQPTHDLTKQKKRAVKMLEDLKNDNATIIKEEQSWISSGVSKISFWGISFNKISLVGEGRLGRQITAVSLTIENMREDEFQPLAITVVESASESALQPV